jgi:amino acid adenylation domain-containing protein
MNGGLDHGNLSPEDKRALLAELIRQRSGKPKYLPVSFAQRRLWFLDQLVPGNPLYNEHAALHFTSAINLPALERSLAAIVARHEVLRTTFTAVGGQPVQVIAQSGVAPLTAIDLRDLGDTVRHAELTRLASEEARQPFDLSRGPLLRTRLVQLADTECVFLLTMHHIISDGWSLGVLARELDAIYSAVVMGRPVPLPPLPIQYADFAVWQRQWLEGPVLSEQLAYWKQQLADLPVLQMPLDRPRPAVPSFRGGGYRVSYSPELLAEVRALSQREGVTVFMTLFAGFQLLLARYTGQDDIVVGAPVAGRNRAELEGLIGFFVNTLVLRTSLAGNPTVRQLLARVRETALAAYAHQDLPFEKLVEELHPHRDLSRNPLFQVMFQLLNTGPAPPRSAAGPGLDITNGTAKFDLLVHALEASNGLHASFEYSTDLFDRETIARLASQYEAVLKAMVAAPEQSVWQLPILPPAEYDQIVHAWNATTRDYPRDRTVVELFEAQTERTPDAAAVHFGEQRLTYAELNARANQLAAELRRRGVRPDVLVAVALERSAAMVIGVLGVLKAGGAYVPLDPGYPPARLAWMLADTRSAVVLSETRLRERLPSEADVIWLDADAARLAALPDTNVPCGATADHLAYVIYTSGSTGLPKGVMVEHRGITRLVLNTNYINIGPTDRIGQVSNFSFDAITFEIWGALLNGACLVGITREVALAPADFVRELREQGVTLMFMTAALFNHVAAHVNGAFSSLRAVLFGGEAGDPKSVRLVLDATPATEFINGYGPTESTTFAVCHHVTSLPADSRTVPIGRPISNTVVYVLDSHEQPVPVGVPGELYIGGDGLARGYFNDPELTARKFVPHPLAGHSGKRLYRTGDRVRYRPDGVLEFMGRLDHQVKIRGFRVEPGEIEAVLADHPQVCEAAVVLREHAPDDKRLVAYVVLSKPTPDWAMQLRAHAHQRLPEYMIPAAYVQLDAMPLTPNGKVDRMALPVHDGANASTGAPVESPATAMERMIAAIWQDALGVENVSVHDNFFDLGGHSLLVAKVHSRLTETLARDIAMVDLFRYPTIRSLSRHLSAEPEPEIRAENPLLRSVNDRVARRRIGARRPPSPQAPSIPGDVP